MIDVIEITFQAQFSAKWNYCTTVGVVSVLHLAYLHDERK